MAKEEAEVESGWATVDLESFDKEEEKLEIEHTDEEEDEIEEESNEDEESEDDDVEESDDDEDEKPAEKVEKRETKRKSRAQERIRQLVAEKKEAQAKADALAAEYAEFKKNSNSTNKSNLEARKELVTNQVDAAKLNLKRAIEDGDVDAQVNYNANLQQLYLDQRVIEAQVSRVPAEVEQKEEQPAKQANAPLDLSVLPDEMQYWLEDNEWAITPTNREERRKVTALREISDELIKDGYLESDGEFYDELDERMSKKFGKSEDDDVDLKNKDSSSRTETAEKKPTKKSKKQTVSGSSRTPSSKSGKVSLSPSERATAKKMGISEERYALRKKNTEAKDGGWTTVQY
jgi:hypothetical protein